VLVGYVAAIVATAAAAAYTVAVFAVLLLLLLARIGDAGTNVILSMGILRSFTLLPLATRKNACGSRSGLVSCRGASGPLCSRYATIGSL
jgi:hypothetical protein